MDATMRSDVDAVPCDVAGLLESAQQLCWRAPEVTLVLADQVARATDPGPESMRAAQLQATVLNRLGRPADAIEKVLPALRLTAAAVDVTGVTAQLRTELARSAVEVGEPGIALALSHEVLADESVPEPLRATALLPAASALAALRDTEGAQQVNTAADACFAEQGGTDPSSAVLQRAWLRAQRAAAHRRAANLDAAEDDARAGLALLVSLPDPDRDAGEVDGWLALELVQVLLDRGLAAEATEVAGELLDRPVRAGSAAPSGWLRVAIATRVHLPAGELQRAADLLTDAVRGAERHRADEMLAGGLDGLSKVHEARGELSAALDDVRSARAAERRRTLAGEAARTLLVAEYGAHRAGSALRDEVVELARGLVPEPALAAQVEDLVDDEADRFEFTGAEEPVADVEIDVETLAVAVLEDGYQDEHQDESEYEEPERVPFAWNDLEPIPDLPQHPALDPATSFDPETGLDTDRPVPQRPQRPRRVARSAGSRHSGTGAVPVSQLINKVAGGPERLGEERGNVPGRHHTPRTLQPPLGSREVLLGGVEPDESDTDEYFPRPLAPEHDTDRTGIIDEVEADVFPPPAPAPRPFDDWPLGQGDERPRMGDLLADAMEAFQHTGHTDPFPTVIAGNFGLSERSGSARDDDEVPASSTDPIFLAVEEEVRAGAGRRSRRSVGD